MPLRLSRERVILYGVMLVLLASLPFVTQHVMPPKLVCTIALLVAAALTAAEVYGFSPWFALIATIAWAPVVNALQDGQNTALALLLVIGTGWALEHRRDWLAGATIGLLLFRPSLALAFVVLLLMRKEWRALAVVAAAAALWYLLSVFATHGQWGWPLAYLHVTASTNAGELASNTYNAYTLPTLLRMFGAPWSFAICASIVVLIGGVALLARAPALEAASLAPAVGLAASLHAWPYEAALLLPALFYAMVQLREPLRSRLVVAAYLIAALALIVPHAAPALAVLSIGGVAFWAAGGYLDGDDE